MTTAILVDVADLKQVLTDKGADNRDGRFLVSGCSMFMGVGPDVLVSQGAKYKVNGKDRDLYAAVQDVALTSPCTVF